jgi:hypothetical protein
MYLMKKRYRLLSLYGVLALALALTACQSATPAPATAMATEPPQPTTAATESKPDTTAALQPAGPTLACKPFSLSFTEVTEKDWSTGAEKASVTILEYSDFQ